MAEDNDYQEAPPQRKIRPNVGDPGNQMWRVRTKHGRDKLFTSPDILFEACMEYFDWVESHPIWETKSYMYQGVMMHDEVPHMRAATMAGLCIFLGIGESTWHDYKTKEGYKEYSEVIKQIERVMYEQKFTGAAAGRLNANIIARDLGLVEKAEVQSSVQVNINGKDAEV